jgi:mersacidin/lichenicidin family type 2 lantibiotic
MKDEEPRLSFSKEEPPLLPDNPTGLLELSDTDWKSIAAGPFPILIVPPVFGTSSGGEWCR